MAAPAAPKVPCPPQEALERFLLESLEEAAAQRVQDHVESCALCQQRLDTLSSNGGSPHNAGRVAWTPKPGFIANLQANHDTAVGGFDVTDDPRAPAETFPQIAGYRIVKVIGQGGMGRVYAAMQEKLGRLVALKTLRDDRIAHDLVERLRREADAIARLQHPNIVQIFDIGDWQQTAGGAHLPYLAMELVPGDSLSRRLTGTPLPPEPAAAIIEKLARAVAAAHQAGIVHRDLKPANVLLQLQSSDNWLDAVPKITDFGLAKDVEVGSNLTETGQVVGTPSYMAPEQVRGQAAQVGPAVDLYALGAILYEMLTGRPPFTGTAPVDILMQVVSVEPVTLRRLVPQVPRDLETICLKCLEKDPVRRYESAVALAEDLRRFLEHKPTLARPLSPIGRALKWARRRPGITGLGSALLFTAFALVALGAWSYFEVSQALDDRTKSLEQEQKAVKSRDEALDAKSALLAKLAMSLKMEQEARQQAEEETYRALFSETSLLRTVRNEGWRKTAWANVARMATMPTQRRNPVALREEIAAALDFPDVAEVARVKMQCISLDFSPDSRTLVAMSQNNLLATREVPSLKQQRFCVVPVSFVKKLKGGTAWPTTIRFQPQSTLPFMPWRDSVGRWAEGQAAPLKVDPLELPKRKQDEEAWQIDFDRSGNLLALGWLDGTASIHDLASGKLAWQSPPLPNPTWTGHPTPVALSSDGEHIAMSNYSQTLWVYRWKESKKPITFMQSKPAPNAFRFSIDDRLIAASYPDDSAVLWNLKGRRPHRTLQGHTSRIQEMSFHPAGRWLATASVDATVRLWDTWSGQLIQTIYPRVGSVSTVAFSPDGKYLAAGGLEVVLYELSLDAARKFAILELTSSGNPYAATQQGALHPVKPHFATAEGSRLVVLDVETGREVRRWDNSINNALGKLTRSVTCFSPRGNLLAASAYRSLDDEGLVGLWDPESGKLLKMLEGQKASVRHLSFDPAGERLLSMGTTDAVVWDVESGKILHRWADVAWSHGEILKNGKVALLVSFNGNYLLADLTTGKMIAKGTLPHPTFRFVLTADDTQVILLSNQQVTRCSLADFKALSHISGDLFRAIAYSPRQDVLATAARNRRVTLWNARTLEKIASLPEEEHNVTHLEFSQDGDRLIVGGLFSRVIAYDLKAIRARFEKYGLGW